MGKKTWIIGYGVFYRGYLCGTLKERVNSPILVLSIIPAQINLPEKLPAALSL